MLRCVASRLAGGVRQSIFNNVARSQVAVQQKRGHGGAQLSDEEFDSEYIKYFSRPEIDHWECRKAMNDIMSEDLVPDPKIVIAALQACRRLNDYAMGVRFLEACKHKCGNNVKEIYPYLLQEIRPTLDELGMNTPEELGYDKPDMYLPIVDEIH